MENFEKNKYLGSGKEGEVWIVNMKKGNKVDYNTRFAVKIFKKTKSLDKFRKEVEFLRKASLEGISPAIIYPSAAQLRRSTVDKIIVMELLEDNLMEILQKQGGTLKTSQQKNLKTIFKTLDKLKINHGDPNPLNFLMNKRGRFMVIDFGFSKDIDEKKVSEMNKRGLEVDLSNVNQRLMSLGLLLNIKQFPWIDVKSFKELLACVEPSKRKLLK